MLVGGRLVAAALLIGAAVALRSNFRASVVLLFWAVAPVGLALIELLVSTPIFVARYFIGALNFEFRATIRARLSGARISADNQDDECYSKSRSEFCCGVQFLFSVS